MPEYPNTRIPRPSTAAAAKRRASPGYYLDTSTKASGVVSQAERYSAATWTRVS